MKRRHEAWAAYFFLLFFFFLFDEEKNVGVTPYLGMISSTFAAPSSSFCFLQQRSSRQEGERGPTDGLASAICERRKRQPQRVDSHVTDRDVPSRSTCIDRESSTKGNACKRLLSIETPGGGGGSDVTLRRWDTVIPQSLLGAGPRPGETSQDLHQCELCRKVMQRSHR